MTFMVLKSGQLAQKAGVNQETLRYYEKEGLLPEPERTDSGYRQYQYQDVQRVRFIKRAQELGFSLKEVKELLAFKIDPKFSAKDVKALTEQKIKTIEDKIRDLELIKLTLSNLSCACSGKGTVDDCPIINSLNSD